MVGFVVGSLKRYIKNMRTLGESLTILREQNKVSKRKLSMRSGIERAHIARWENRRINDIGFKKVVLDLSKGFELSPEDMAKKVIEIIRCENGCIK